MKAKILLLLIVTVVPFSKAAFAQMIAPIRKEEAPAAPATPAPLPTRALAIPETVKSAPAPKDVCTAATLEGTYSFQLEGSINSGGARVNQVGLEVFDGQGHVSARVTTKREGRPSRSLETYVVGYTIRPDCTGTLFDEKGVYADLYIEPGGDAFRYVFVSPEHLISGETRRVSRRKLSLAP